MAAGSGISFLASSGDQGSADCVDLTGAPVARLSVNYPSSSPWVTGVGGTNFALTPANTIAAQIVWNDTSLQPGAAGGGGTSQLFKRPSYQKGTVNEEPPLPARRVDARRHRARLHRVLLGHARLRQLREHQPVADGRRHQRGDAAARRRARAGRPEPAPQRPPRRRLRQPAALQDRPQPGAARHGVLRRAGVQQRHRPVHHPQPPLARVLQRRPRLRPGLGLGQRQPCGPGRGGGHADPPARRPVAPAPSASRQARGSVRDLVVLGGLPGRRVRRRPDRPRQGRSRSSRGSPRWAQPARPRS